MLAATAFNCRNCQPVLFLPAGPWDSPRSFRKPLYPPPPRPLRVPSRAPPEAAQEMARLMECKDAFLARIARFVPDLKFKVETETEEVVPCTVPSAAPDGHYPQHCMCSYAFTCVRVCTHVFMCIHMCSCGSCVFTCVHMCSHVFIYVHMCSCMFTCANTCACVYDVSECSLDLNAAFEWYHPSSISRAPPLKFHFCFLLCTAPPPQ